MCIRDRYQGILFVLVMMFMPEGLAGLFQKSSQLRRRIGWARLVPVLLACLVAAVLLAAGTVFVVELLQRLFSQDYRALANGAAWPPVTLFGRSWLPTAPTTWIVPVALFAAGGGLVAAILRGLVRASPADEAASQPPPALGDASRSAA